MKRKLILIAILILVFTLTACTLAQLAPMATLPPTNTLISPTATPTPEPVFVTLGSPFAANFVQSIQERQGVMISSIEEIAYRMEFISLNDLVLLSKGYENSYGAYL